MVMSNVQTAWISPHQIDLTLRPVWFNIENDYSTLFFGVNAETEAKAASKCLS